jgi:hypothetical protein
MANKFAPTGVSELKKPNESTSYGTSSDCPVDAGAIQSHGCEAMGWLTPSIKHLLKPTRCHPWTLDSGIHAGITKLG